MAFTRQHYKAIAEIIKTREDLPYGSVYRQATSDIANDLSDYFASDNKRFDRGRFLSACGIE